MAKLVFLNKDNKLLGELELSNQNLYNRIIKRKKSFLDLALDNDIQLNYACMGGSCSACKCDIIEGLEFLNKEEVSKQIYANVKENECLTCIASIKDEFIDKDIKIVFRQNF